MSEKLFPASPVSEILVLAVPALESCAEIMRHQASGYPSFGRNCIVRYNVGDNPLQVVQCFFGEEYFVIHSATCSRDSSNGIRSPRSSDANPSSTDCRNSSS